MGNGQIPVLSCSWLITRLLPATRQPTPQPRPCVAALRCAAPASGAQEAAAAELASLGLLASLECPQPRSLELEDLRRLPFITACIKEALRMVPVVSIMGRWVMTHDSCMSHAPAVHVCEEREEKNLPTFAWQGERRRTYLLLHGRGAGAAQKCRGGCYVIHRVEKPSLSTAVGSSQPLSESGAPPGGPSLGSACRGAPSRAG